MDKKAIVIGYLSKVSFGNVNASYTEGNVMIAKKVTLPDGSTIPYISGQAVRRMLRDRLEDLGWQLSEPFSDVSGQEVTPPVEPWNYIDEDLFGYMDTKGGRRRTSPTRVSSLIGLFKYQGDRDLGTRSFEKYGKEMEAGGNIFETEVYNNLFKGNILIELDRVGVYLDREVQEKNKKEIVAPDNCEKKELPASKFGEKRWALFIEKNERIKRLKAFHDALMYLWGGGRTARMLADLSPRFVTAMFLEVKHPVFLEAFKVEYEGGYILDIQALKVAVQKFDGHYDELLIGMEPGFFKNEEEIKKEFANVKSVKEVIDTIKKKIDEL